MLRIRIGLLAFGIAGLASANLHPVMAPAASFAAYCRETGRCLPPCVTDWECESRFGGPIDLGSDLPLASAE